MQLWSAGAVATATQVDVRLQSMDLGASANFAYDLQSVDTTDPKNPKVKSLASGVKALTKEQFAAWGSDDAYAAKCIVAAIGLTVAP